MDAIGNNKMALPAWEKSDFALRTDLVVLEQNESDIQVAFWEAKTFDDARLRSETRPEVIDQLLGIGKGSGYVGYLNYGDHEADIRDAYVQTCSILTQLHVIRRAVASAGNEN